MELIDCWQFIGWLDEDISSSLEWKCKDVRPQWESLKYKSEDDARTQGIIDDEQGIRNYTRYLTATPHFNISFNQTPINTRPFSFREDLSFVLRKEFWEDQMDGVVPEVSIFAENATDEQRDYFSSPRFTLENQTHLTIPTLLSYGILQDIGYSRFMEVNGASDLVRTLILREIDIIEGMREGDENLLRSYESFMQKICAGFGREVAGTQGINLEDYHYGT